MKMKIQVYRGPENENNKEKMAVYNRKVGAARADLRAYAMRRHDDSS